MRRGLSGVLVIAALVVAMVAGASKKAEAGFIMALCNDAVCSGGGDVFIPDNGAGDLAFLASGAIGFFGTFGGYSLVLNGGLSKPFVGSAADPVMDLSYLVASSGPADAWFWIADTSFTKVGNLSLTVGGTQSPTGSVAAFVAGGDSNSDLNLNPVLASLGAFSGVAYGGSTSFAVDSGDPYSLALGVHVVRNGAGVTSGDALLVPEPASVALFGLALLGFGLATRRRSSRRRAARS